MRSYPVKEIPISSAVSEILQYKHTHRQIDILLLYYEDSDMYLYFFGNLIYFCCIVWLQFFHWKFENIDLVHFSLLPLLELLQHNKKEVTKSSRIFKKLKLLIITDIMKSFSI